MSGAGEVTGGGAARTLELRRGEAAPEELAKLEKVAAGFETLFTSTLLGELLKPMQGGGFAGEGPGASVVQGLLETHLSDHIAKSGGFGLGAMVVRTLKPMLAARAVSAAELTSKLPPAAVAGVPAAMDQNQHQPRKVEDGR